MSTPTFEKGAVTVYFGEKSGKYPDGNQVVVRGRDTQAAFDTPIVANRLREVLTPSDLIILGHMHEDHIAGLHFLPQARVYAHEADLEATRSWAGLARHYGYPQAVLDDMRIKIERQFNYVERPDALGYADGALWDLGGTRVRAIHMPGHTAGHCVLLVEPEGVAFIGDIDLSSFGPYYGDATSSLVQFRHTLRRVREVPATAWVTSHHKGVITERETFLALLDAYAAKLEAREDAIAAQLAAQPSTLDELVAQRFVYPRGYEDVFIDAAERRTIAQHLASLLRAGRVTEDGDRFRVAR
ncbi:MAG TPA: MBL fold metallo-hydrolase [Burkholderiales bacterium]|nr:MBL fold metallo-hydrolase [Burkholderiales bacterium]